MLRFVMSLTLLISAQAAAAQDNSPPVGPSSGALAAGAKGAGFPAVDALLSAGIESQNATSRCVDCELSAWHKAVRGIGCLESYAKAGFRSTGSKTFSILS
jgi:hypothetical protein